MTVEFVLDASAMLATIHREPGADRVADILPRSAMSTVNLTEAFQSVLERGLSIEDLASRIESFGVLLEVPTVADAELAAALRLTTRDSGLSLADRFCLALAERLGATAVTADRAWVRSDHGVSVELIR